MTIKCGLKPGLIQLLLNGHPEDVCRALQEGYVVLAELAFRCAIYFQYAEG